MPAPLPNVKRIRRFMVTGAERESATSPPDSGMAALGHSVLMVGADVVVLRRDDPVPLRKAVKPLPPDEFCTRMNVNVALPACNDLSRIVELPHAVTDGPPSELRPFGRFAIVDPDELLLARRESAPARTGQHPIAKVAQTELDEGVAEPEKSSTSAFPGRIRHGRHYLWTQDEIEFMRESAIRTNFDWGEVAHRLSRKFGAARRPRYTASAVMYKYRHEFPEEAPLPRPAQVSGKEPSWTRDELDFLRVSARTAGGDWAKVAVLVNEQFGSTRSAHSAMVACKRYFPDVGAAARRSVDGISDREEALLTLPESLQTMHVAERNDEANSDDLGARGSVKAQPFGQPSWQRRFAKRPRPRKRWTEKRNPDQGSW